MKSLLYRIQFLFLLVLCFCCPSYGQIELLFSHKGQIEQDCRDFQFYLVSLDTTRMIEVPAYNNEIIDCETIIKELGDSIWMVVISYKKDYYFIGLISSTDYRMLSTESEIILLSPGFRKYDDKIMFIKGFRIIWRNITTYGKSTQSFWKTKKQCIYNAKKIIKKASSSKVVP